MTDTRTTPQREIATLLPPALALLAILQFATGHGAHHRELALAGLVVAATQVLPGALVWRSVRPVHGWLIEDLAMGLGIGAAMAVAGHVLGVAVGLPVAGGLLPLVLGGVLLAAPATRRRILSRELSPLPIAWALTTVVSCVGPLLAVLQGFVPPVRFRGFLVPYVDLPFHNALAGEVKNHFPPYYPQSSLEPLTYHWFSHAWTAQISTLSGTPLEILLWRFNPSLLMVAVPVLTAVAAVRICRNAWAGPIAALVAFLLPDLSPWASNGVDTPLASTNSPSQQFGMLLVVAVITLLAVRWREDAPRATLPLLVLLLVLTGGAKGSTLPVIVLGAVLATAAMAVCKDWARLRTVGLDAALTVVVLGLLNVIMFAGGDGGVALDFGQEFTERRAPGLIGQGVSDATGLAVLVGVLGLLSMLLGPLAGLVLPALRATRSDPVVWLLLGCGAAGVGGIFALSHPGSAQGYFYKAGQPAIAIAAAWGVVALFERTRATRVLACVGAGLGIAALQASLLVARSLDAPSVRAAVVSTLAFLGLLALGAALAARTTRTWWPGALAVAAAALVAAPAIPAAQAVVDFERTEAKLSPTPVWGGIHARDVAALRWLRDHSSPDDVVITNDHCRSYLDDPCDRRRFFVAGYAERRVLIEGWTYTTKASELYADYGSNKFSNDQFWDQELLALNDGFIEDPTDEAAARLWDLGVRWVVVWRRAPHAQELAPFAERVREAKSLIIYRLARPDR